MRELNESELQQQVVKLRNENKDLRKTLHVYSNEISFMNKQEVRYQ